MDIIYITINNNILGYLHSFPLFIDIVFWEIFYKIGENRFLKCINKNKYRYLFFRMWDFESKFIFEILYSYTEFDTKLEKN